MHEELHEEVELEVVRKPVSSMMIREECRDGILMRLALRPPSYSFLVSKARYGSELQRTHTSRAR